MIGDKGLTLLTISLCWRTAVVNVLEFAKLMMPATVRQIRMLTVFHSNLSMIGRCRTRTAAMTSDGTSP
ncbi:hypothetical protein D3C72_2581340 [compost metagenome]